MPRGRDFYTDLYTRLAASPSRHDGPGLSAFSPCHSVQGVVQRLSMASEQVTVLLPRQDATFCLVGDTRRCYGCGELFEREALMRCAKCKVAYYCTRACQRRHWAAHRAPCLQNQQYPKKWRRMVEACDTAYRMLVRLDSCTLDDDPRRFVLGSTQSHLHKTKPEYLDECLTIAMFARHAEGIDIFYLDPATLLDIARELLRANLECVRAGVAVECADMGSTLATLHGKVTRELKHRDPAQNTFVAIVPFDNTGVWMRGFQLPISRCEQPCHWIRVWPATAISGMERARRDARKKAERVRRLVVKR